MNPHSQYLEYLDYYLTGKKPEGGIIALVVEITDNEKNAKLTLNKVKKIMKSAFMIKSRIYMGCMH